ncbi:MAG: hypothetical protein FWF18_04000 [Dehalococcoidia bacterium]|nr:hypothetical protein [Dehalococcoidia bacterium]
MKKLLIGIGLGFVATLICLPAMYNFANYFGMEMTALMVGIWFICAVIACTFWIVKEIRALRDSLSGTTKVSDDR